MIYHLYSNYMHSTGEECRLWNGLFLQLLDLCDLDLDLGSSHMAYWRVALIDFYVHTKFCWKWTNILWTDRRMYEWTVRPALLDRLWKPAISTCLSHSNFKNNAATERKLSERIGDLFAHSLSRRTFHSNLSSSGALSTKCITLPAMILSWYVSKKSCIPQTICTSSKDANHDRNQQTTTLIHRWPASIHCVWQTTAWATSSQTPDCFKRAPKTSLLPRASVMLQMTAPLRNFLEGGGL